MSSAYASTASGTKISGTSPKSLRCITTPIVSPLPPAGCRILSTMGSPAEGASLPAVVGGLCRSAHAEARPSACALLMTGALCGAEQVDVRSSDQLCFGNFKPFHQSRHAATPFSMGLPRLHAPLEFDKRSQPLHFVDMHPRLAQQIHPPLLAHNATHTQSCSQDGCERRRSGRMRDL